MNDQSITQLQTDIKDMKGKVDTMFFALMGNEIAKDGGLVGRIETLETVHEKIDERMTKIETTHTKLEVYQKVMWVFAGGFGSFLISFVIELIKK